MMEAFACRDGIQFAREESVASLQVETDCQELVRLWALGNNQRSYIVPVIREMVELSSGK